MLSYMIYEIAIHLKTRFSISRGFTSQTFAYILFFRLSTLKWIMAANNNIWCLSEAVNPSTSSSQRTDHHLSLQTSCQCSKRNKFSISILPQIQREQSSQPDSKTCPCDFIFPHSNSSQFLNITFPVSFCISRIFWNHCC